MRSIRALRTTNRAAGQPSTRPGLTDKPSHSAWQSRGSSAKWRQRQGDLMHKAIATGCAAALLAAGVLALAPGAPVAAQGAAQGAAQEAPKEANAEPAVHITASEDAVGNWTVTYRFAEPQTALVLSQAPVTYREWEPLSEGVSMWRIGGMEGFVFDEPAQEARFRIDTYSEDIPAAYTPFLAFSDGSYGVLTGQFRVKPIGSLDEARAFDGTGESWPQAVMTSRVSIGSPRPITPSENGVHSVDPGVSDGTYIYIGDLAPVEGSSFSGFVDPGMPEWLSNGFDRDLGVIFSQLSQGWGIELEDKARVFLVFRGLEGDGLFMTGGAIGSLLSLEMGGSQLAEPIPEIRTYVRWFIAHEAAHVFQQAAGNSDVLFSASEHAWVHEGSANTFSYRIGASLADDPQGFLKESYAAEYRDCVAHLGQAPLVDAREMGNFRAYYACGDLIALATDAMLPDHDLYDFWRAYQAASETAAGATRAQLYFGVLRDLGAPEEGVERLKSFVAEKPEDAAAFVEEMMAHFGLPIAFDENGEFAGITLRAATDRKALHD